MISENIDNLRNTRKKNDESIRRRISDFWSMSEKKVLCCVEARIAIFHAQNNLSWELADKPIQLIKCIDPSDKYISKIAMSTQKTESVTRYSN